MKRLMVLSLCLIIAGCGDDPGEDAQKGREASLLDEQAVAAGLLPDPDNLSLSGQFETRSTLGVDKFCATQSSAGFDIGVLAVFGPESKCEAQGTARLGQENLRINFRGEDECAFVAEYDGVELRFPGAMPEECNSYCTKRASFSGTSYFMIAQGDDAARRTLGRDINRLCQ